MAHLAQRVEATVPLKPRLTLFGNAGEDVAKVTALHVQEHPEDAEVNFTARMIVWGAPPRPELCTAESIAVELPRIRVHIARMLSTPGQGPSTYEEALELQRAWRSLSDRFGLDYITAAPHLN